MANILVLRLQVNRLVTEPAFKGIFTPESKKSLSAKIKGVETQLSLQADYFLRNTTDSEVIIYISSNDTAPPPSDNTTYLELLELLTSLEEDCFAIQNGDKTPIRKKSYNTHAKELRAALKALRNSFGIPA